MSVQNVSWWRGGVIYQIYPRSFKDTNGDGIGDLNGITEKLPYIASLGVDAIWISPFMTSPMKDFGYDVSDYCSVDPMFGTMDDFKAMLKAAHDLNLKIIIDLIYSHTSDQHPWFQESRKSRNNPKSDWYVWADPKPDGTPPTNWLSVFGGSSWQYDSWRGQYYLHNFLREQPDLNFHNPDVQEAMLDMTRFWLELGVDGLRLDAINFAVHDKQLRDNPARGMGEQGKATQLDFLDPYSMQWHKYDKSQPEMLDFLEKVRSLLNEFPGTMALGEVGDDDEISRAIEYSSGDNRLHTCYNFSLCGAKPDNVQAIRAAVEVFHKRADGSAWPAWAFSNHDLIRAVSRWSGAHATSPVIAKTLIALITSLRGTPFLYQGEELGLPDTKVAFEDIQDPWGKYLYPKWQGRDGCRTPMPWGGNTLNLGFTEDGVKPWLPMNPDFSTLTSERQRNDPHSTLAFTRSFLKWRKKNSVLIEGDIQFFESNLEGCLCFARHAAGSDRTFYFNLSPDTCDFEYAGTATSAFEWPDVTGVHNEGGFLIPAFGFVII